MGLKPNGKGCWQCQIIMNGNEFSISVILSQAVLIGLLKGNKWLEHQNFSPQSKQT